MAYTTVINLIKILSELQDPDQPQNIYYPKSDILHLQEKVRFLKYFLEVNSSVGDLEVKIRESLYNAEDVVESNLSNYALYSENVNWSEEKYMSRFSRGLQRVITDVDSILETVREKGLHVKQSLFPTSSVLDLNPKNITVGRKDELVNLKDWVMEGSENLETVRIFGISGIGKTHLAQIIYEDQDIQSKFVRSAWVKVSLEYSKKEILLGLLRSMTKLGSGKGQEISEDDLSKRLSKILNGKYLIVLDDVCNPEAWDNLKVLFPDENNGSRVVLTTRHKEVAESAQKEGHFLEIHPLNVDESWSLLQNKVFPYKSCPMELEVTAKSVSEKCRGLPLAIITIGGVLMNSGKNDWQIASSSLSKCSDCDQVREAVMLLNFTSLHQYAKACLLYMGIFPDNYEIPVSKLFQLWIAEGFIEKMEEFQSVEKLAEKCFSELLNRGIILVSQQSPIGRARTCRVDGLYHDFLKKRAKVENFFHVVDGYTSHFPDENCNQGRFCILKNIHFVNRDESKSNKMVPTVRSLLFGGAQEQYPLWVHLDFKLLRVLDALKIRFYSFPNEILNLVHLRYLALTYNGEIPKSICRLWNLQFLIILRHLSSKYSNVVLPLPKEIWNLNQLRHLQLMGSELPNSSTCLGRHDDGILLQLKHLLTLLDVSSHSCTPGIFKRIPNLKKLGVRIESPALDAAEDFSFLRHVITLACLESLKCVVIHPDFGSQVVSSIPSFPTTLKKLSLSGCGFSWDYMEVIATLPNLEALKLRWYAFRGCEWVQGGNGLKFPGLKFLLLEDLDIEHWKCSHDHFPLLTNLIISHCYKLQELPSGIGYIPTLKRIELVDCNSSAVKSAQQIKAVQQKRKHYIQVDFHSSRDD